MPANLQKKPLRGRKFIYGRNICNSPKDISGCTYSAGYSIILSLLQTFKRACPDERDLREIGIVELMLIN
jgi:hypothetical protein